jgi:hypothetical protein
MNSHNDTPNPEEAQAQLLARAYSLILSWPCPLCGRPFPCPHDTESEVAGEVADEKQEEVA